MRSAAAFKKSGLKIRKPIWGSDEKGEYQVSYKGVNAYIQSKVVRERGMWRDYSWSAFDLSGELLTGPHKRLSDCKTAFVYYALKNEPVSADLNDGLDSVLDS